MMKKTLLSFAIVAASALVSCQGQIEPSNQKESADGAKVFTASIDNAITRTTLGAATGDPATYPVNWASGDEVTINGVTYTVTPDGTDATKATLTKNDSGAADPTGTFNAFYPADIQIGATAGGTLPAEQAYTAGAISNLPMYATATGTSLTFKNICAVLAVTVKKADFSPVKSIRVSSSNCALSGAFTVIDGKAVLTEASTVANTVTLNCATAVTTATDGTVFYISIPAQTYRNLKIEISADGTSYTKSMTTKKDTDIIVAVNTIYPLIFKSDDFSVSSTKSVRFTNGNLWWGKKGTEATATWHLEDSQTAYPTSWNADHVGHLFWTKDAAKSYASTYSDGTISTSDVPFFAESQGGLTVDGESGLYALTGGNNGEWKYLIESRTNSSSLCKYGVSVTTSAGVVTNCVVIAPDNWDYTNKPLQATYSAEEWATVESAGLVCLPAAGYRDGSSLGSGGSNGRYWSATPYTSIDSFAFGLKFSGSSVNTFYFGGRHYGHSVRLVCSVSSK